MRLRFMLVAGAALGLGCGGGELDVANAGATGGNAGAAANAGAGGGTAGTGNSSGNAGTSGSAANSGSGGSSATGGSGGSSATGGSAGTAGTSGTGGSSATGGSAGTAGNSGTAGTGGSAATGGSSGTAGSGGSGGTASCVDPVVDCPAPPTTCLIATCDQGVCAQTPATAGTMCDDNGGTFCDDQGNCIACLSEADCPAPANECVIATCAMGFCGTDNVALGVVTQSGQIAGDCKVVVCDGAGATVSQDDDTDTEDDSQSCTTDSCSGGVSQHLAVDEGTACNENSGKVCGDPNNPTIAGKCVECNKGADCQTGVCGANNTCLSAECGDSVKNGFETDVDCGGADCGATCQDNQACNSGTDCLSNHCLSGACVAGTCTDNLFNNAQLGETDIDCGGPNCNPCHFNQACSVNSDCLGGTCTNQICVATCSDTEKNGTETDIDCGGSCAAFPANLKCINAQDCVIAADCVSGYCDGMNKCAACSLDSQCASTEYCNNGVCSADLSNGSTCSTGAQCQSNNCVDGVCCDAACSGLCQACNVAGSVGTCSSIPAGGDPANECAGATSCDGAGACAFFTNGTACAVSAECQSNNCIDGVCCNSVCGGLCQACNVAGSVGTCSNIPTNTDPANECAGTDVCNGSGLCVKVNATACGANAECLSGNCVDGVCCNTACSGLCQACNVAGNVGVCSNIPASSDPANECAGATSCNGSGACSTFGNGTACTINSECSSANCVDGVCCDSACSGICQACNVAGSLGTCAPVPVNTDPANECAGADVCDGAGNCSKVVGSLCGAGGECLSGFCVDGVCCNSACGGTCQACDVAGSIGTCSNVPGGTDPANECIGATTCNGSGSCTLLGNGTACAFNAECSSGSCVDGVCCNTSCSGTCEACNLAGSVGTCSSIPTNTDPENECAGTDVCNGSGLCVKVNATACGANAECLSGNCVDGVCCNTACSGLCQACNVAGSIGTCSSVPAATDPANECTGATTCNGAGACSLLGNGTACTLNAECSSGSCVDGVCCNTACSGTCQACSAAKTGGVNGTCSNIPANTDPDNECTTECNGAGACESAQGTACTQNSQCQSGSCVDGFCCDTACNGICQACSAAKNGGTNGTCGNIPLGTDPDNECAGIFACNGSGSCTSSGDGSSIANAGGSCLTIHNNFPSLTNGTYWIDPDGAGSIGAFQAYCDMVSDGGGYTFFKVDAGSQYNAAQAEANCASRGMRLWIPRTPTHLLSGWSIANNAAIGPNASVDYMRILGIYPKFNGATCANQPMNSSNVSCGWQAGDGHAWYVHNVNSISEPNGDNSTTGSMYYAWTAGAIQWHNDIGGAGYTSQYFMCDVADKWTP